MKNNRYKFRCYDKRNKEMCYSDKENGDGCFYINTKGFLFMYALPKSETGVETKYYKSYDVMECTLVPDTTGKEIWESDIISDKEGVLRVVDWCWESAHWIARHLPNEPYCEPVYLEDNWYTIKGNMYEK